VILSCDEEAEALDDKGKKEFGGMGGEAVAKEPEKGVTIVRSELIEKFPNEGFKFKIFNLSFGELFELSRGERFGFPEDGWGWGVFLIEEFEYGRLITALGAGVKLFDDD
jgi:hypothetical protein